MELAHISINNQNHKEQDPPELEEQESHEIRNKYTRESAEESDK